MAADFELATLTDIGTDRGNNEDACGHWVESLGNAILVVADGVGGYEGGEVASQMAVEVTLAAYRDAGPQVATAKRLFRAVQRANIEIYNRKLAVPELGRMATTLTSAAISDGVLYAAHVGDCRLYLIRDGKIQQLSNDHTVIGERVRLGLISQREARNHPDRSALSRCLGQELIASIDRITIPLRSGDQVLLCSDGLHGVFEDLELAQLMRGLKPEAACQRLIATANEHGATDNVTAAMLLIHNGAKVVAPTGWRGCLLSWWRRGN
jgi:PPM family protein phosphatase